MPVLETYILSIFPAALCIMFHFQSTASDINKLRNRQNNVYLIPKLIASPSLSWNISRLPAQQIENSYKTIQQNAYHFHRRNKHGSCYLRIYRAVSSLPLRIF